MESPDPQALSCPLGIQATRWCPLSGLGGSTRSCSWCLTRGTWPRGRGGACPSTGRAPGTPRPRRRPTTPGTCGPAPPRAHASGAHGLSAVPGSCVEKLLGLTIELTKHRAQGLQKPVRLFPKDCRAEGTASSSTCGSSREKTNLRACSCLHSSPGGAQGTSAPQPRAWPALLLLCESSGATQQAGGGAPGLGLVHFPGGEAAHFPQPAATCPAGTAPSKASAALLSELLLGLWQCFTHPAAPGATASPACAPRAAARGVRC